MYAEEGKSKSTMKRHSRMTATNICMIPRKAIAWIIMSMALLSMISLMAIEIRRILVMRSLRKAVPFQTETNEYLPGDNMLNHHHQQHDIQLWGIHQGSHNQINYFQQAKTPWRHNNNDSSTKNNSDSDAIEALFEDHPYCHERPYLLILVTSGPENFERREAIRKAWANPDGWKLHVSGLKSKVLFLVGRSTTKFLNILLKNENDITGDILLGDYSDTYRNLTTKVVHGFTWAAHHCKPNYLLKTDDDCFVNVPLLLQFLSKYNPVPDNLYVGKIRWSAPVIRDPNSRWYVSKTEFPKQRYAPYAIGAGYIFSYDVLEKLVRLSDKIHVFPNEDAFVGTVLNAAGVRPTYSERFVTHPGPWQTCNFLYLFVVHKVKASRQSEYKDMANAAVEKCSVEHIVTDWV